MSHKQILLPNKMIIDELDSCTERSRSVTDKKTINLNR